MNTQQQIRIRQDKDRGHIDHGWLDARHTFSFGSYQDPDWMGFRSLRVINEDSIAPRMGFGEHGHRDMEIITYPVSGAVRHRDSLGNEEDIVPGMIQHMSAGSGIRHSEFNPLDERTHMLQIWIEPREVGIEPGHQSRAFPIHEQGGRLHLVASPDGEGGSLTIQQDARVLAGVFGAGERFKHAMRDLRHAWVQVVRGALSVNGVTVSGGDGLALHDIGSVELSIEEDSEVLVFELA
ncbi:MAG: quercetin 2,3-dioxygenase [Phycisphaerae bacterium]|nr:quercetin 2,3-dioxygenase [Phycisphaerae bacterium]MBM90595.1 quercetin 2,3-dioxygenase [Phycisphaerae bacterium]HCT46186.1 quercetin 2,3-dioxygenase [Phycisphaerales bacterium]